MKRTDFARMSVDDLWALRSEITEALSEKIMAEKRLLEERLDTLKRSVHSEPRTIVHARRPYPPVPPKFCNPEDPSQTWAGRGKQPRWLISQLRTGKRIDDFRIQAVG